MATCCIYIMHMCLEATYIQKPTHVLNKSADRASLCGSMSKHQRKTRGMQQRCQQHVLLGPQAADYDLSRADPMHSKSVVHV
jgi:hypothetical protein